MEIETVMSYLANSVNADGVRAPDGVRAQELIKSLREGIQGELGHATSSPTASGSSTGSCPARWASKPEQSYLQPPERQTDIVHVIKGVIEAEAGAIDHCNQVIEAADESGPGTNDMVIAILHDEEGHRRLFEGCLREHQEQS
jgi:bacterioferritin